ncbi:N-acetylmuramic acid 6-phosphate etherase [Bacillus kwashiorkori]|uniref:N-acetylmuramic acid 6-phosphate etherase n=1 Tax=Bacillus kwashiorkori TaxID=1522318 RepID=UPI000780DDB9|nr:N-acetylmuramic acid 6-phosphate etherase [Bacillus kwashiorkori]
MGVILSNLLTEQCNERTRNIDQLEIREIVEMMNNEDQTVSMSVKQVLPDISRSAEIILEAMRDGGRLFYTGAGTSGRLGVLDAAECPPTFRTPHELVQGIMAGGEGAMFRAVEGAEDDPKAGADDLKERKLTEKDVVVGIAASGRTPYVIGALQYAREIGAKTIALACNKNAEISQYADQKIEVLVGPEVLTGSTRLKAATAQKMILNMLSTSVMIKLGKVYRNLMVDLHASNSKLLERARQIVIAITGVDYETAAHYLKLTDQHVKPAIVMIEGKVSYEEANLLLNNAEQSVAKALELLTEQNGVK